MRILMTSAHSHEGETGSALIAKTLATELSKKHQVLYMHLSDRFKVKKVSKNLTFLGIPKSDIHGVQIPYVTIGIKNKAALVFEKFNPDVVHAQNIIFDGVLAALWAKEHNVPYLLTLHHIPHEGVSYIFPKLKEKKFLHFLDRIYSTIYINTFIKLSSLVIALNKTIISSLNIINPNSKYVEINNGIELKKFQALKINKPQKTINFIYPGSYIDRKNQIFLVKAFRYLPKNYILNLYGHRELGFSYTVWLEEISKKYHLNNVHVNDYAIDKDLLNAYEKSNYLISASIKEVQSLVIIEAMASGKPIIGLKNETINELVNNTNGLSLPQGTSPKVFADKVKQYVQKTNKNYLNVAKATRLSSSRFDVVKVAPRVAAAYGQAIKNHEQNDDKNEGRQIVLQLFLVISIILSVLARSFSIISSLFSRQLD